MVFENLILDAEVVEQRLRTGVLPMMTHKPPRMAMRHSIRNSHLLISSCARTHKRQLSDFFSRQLRPLPTSIRRGIVFGLPVTRVQSSSRLPAGPRTHRRARFDRDNSRIKY
jgi:hypothetical protein